MSKKKKTKAPAKKAKAKKTKKRSAAPSNRTAAATIFIYKVNGATRVRTAPQRLSAGPGNIEWTVVNLVSDDPVDVDITWKTVSPWGGKKPIPIRGGNYRRSMAGASHGLFRYNVTADGYTEDPELEIPGN